MRQDDIDRVFGRSRLKMVTGEHVEVFREESLPGERRRYTKRFLWTTDGDFRHWTEREWRILARLVGHGIGPVPDVVQFDRGATDRPALVQTYDAGVTIDHWATLLPVERDGRVLRHVFEDCAHWWALARHSLIALDAIHELRLVHLDLKPDNVCIPLAPADFDPQAPGQWLHPAFDQIALIDFAFSLVSGESLATALPIGHQFEYDYQSPRLLRALEAGRQGDLQPTRQLDWRCDVFSLAAMLQRYLPHPDSSVAGAWTRQRHEAAQALICRLFDAHHAAMPTQRPHRELIELAAGALRDPGLASSLERGWRLAAGVDVSPFVSPTPITRIALPVSALPSHREREGAGGAASGAEEAAAGAVPIWRHRERDRRLAWAAGAMAMAALSVPFLGEAWLARQGGVVHVAEPVVPAAEEEAVARAAAEGPAIAPAGESAAVDEAAAAPAAASEPAPVPAPMPAPAPTPLPAPEAKTEPAPAPVGVAAPVAPPVRAARPPAVATRTTPAPKPAAKAVYAIKPAPKPAAAPKAWSATRVAKAPVFPMPARAPAPAPEPAPAIAAAPPPAPSPAPVPTPAAPPAPPPAAERASATVMAPPPVTASVPIPASSQPREASAPAAPLPEEFAARAGALLSDHIPRIAQRAERLVLRVLHVAAGADNPWQASEVVEAARTARLMPDEVLSAVLDTAGDARRLNDAAGAAFWNGRSAPQALSLQTRAFGANPNDAEVAGNLAFYYLKYRPAQPESARRLALYALTLQDPRFPNGRIEDWTTFAIASALAGRERDARNAFFTTLALSQTLDRPCRAALAAYASHGEKLRAPTEAMLFRIRGWGRSQESTFCHWPPSWSARVGTP